MGRVFPAEFVTIKHSYFLEPTMLELLKSLVFAVVMVPVVMAVILGLIYGLGEVFNLFSGAGHKDSRPQNH
ncbi:Multidrug efflux pump accessory protein AcrZ [Klebsiella spallanzanii]|nr:Multidrug efflux pump accessory protein AcrZ [Klebsiella spallanzanii]